MEIKIKVENAEKEIKLLDEASSLIGKLKSILHELENGICECKSFAKAYTADDLPRKD